jgi:hypothetical protein
VNELIVFLLTDTGLRASGCKPDIRDLPASHGGMGMGLDAAGMSETVEPGPGPPAVGQVHTIARRDDTDEPLFVNERDGGCPHESLQQTRS